MQTQCTPKLTGVQPCGRRRVDVAFDAGDVSSDGGLVLLREVAQLSGFFDRVASCFIDHRDPERIEHTVQQLTAQRILGMACGYEDLNDHDTLRLDPLFAMAAGKLDPRGLDRKRERDHGRALAGHATLNRIETAPAQLNPARPDLKILHDPAAFERLFVDMFIDAHELPPTQIILDVDATDDPIHGDQEGRFFHGYYNSYCYLPLYIFCGDFLLVAKLRKADQDGAAGALEQLQRVVAQIHQAWPSVRIIIRGDSGFCRDRLMDWCEQQHHIDYVLGLARNKRLTAMISEEMAANEAEAKETGEAVRTMKELRYRTKKSWSRERRVVAKAEALRGKQNPRFVVTNLPRSEYDAAELYGDLYCARGDMENRIKEQQLGMFADRTSSHTMRANQLRLWFSSLAYVLVNELRAVGLRGTQLARAQVWTIRARLLKVGALIHQSVRRMKVSLSSAFPLKEVWVAALRKIAEVREDLVM
ncbi:MAG: IS1380 family transposase [Vicinamibacterales bacterium]|nr:IS1380 family transposase [Vicinamibacterales bacterium]